MSRAFEVTATEFSNRRGELLDAARAGNDVIVRRNNRIAAVMISSDRYEKLENLERIFDEYTLNLKADSAKKNMLSREESDALTKKIMAAIKE